MPDQRGCNGKPLCQPSQPPHEYGPGIRPKDATDKEARAPRYRGRSVVALYNEVRTHLSLEKDTPVSRAVERTGHILCRPVLGGCTTNISGFDLRQAQGRRFTPAGYGTGIFVNRVRLSFGQSRIS